MRIVKTGDGRLYWSTRGDYYSNEKKVVNAGSFQLSTARQYYKLTSMQKDGRIVYHLDPFSGRCRWATRSRCASPSAATTWKYLMIEDPIPSGTESIARDDLYELDEQPTWWGRWFSDRELRDDRTTFFNLYFPQGQHEYVYLLKVVNPGVFRVSPTSVQPMYQPEYLSTSDAHYGDGEMNAKHKGAAKVVAAEHRRQCRAGGVRLLLAAAAGRSWLASRSVGPAGAGGHLLRSLAARGIVCLLPGWRIPRARCRVAGVSVTRCGTSSRWSCG